MSRTEETTHFWDACPAVREDLLRVQEVVDREILRSGGTVAAGLHEFARRDSKLLRPGLIILAARIQKGTEMVSRRLVSIAAAIEMLHLASLVHDDIIDGADYRRGSPALHRTFPTETAVLMGDYLFARCFRLLAGNARSENIALVSSAAARIVTSEISGLDTESAGTQGTGIRSYRRRIMGKTAILFVLGLHLGITEGHGPHSDPHGTTAAVLRRIGFNVGMAFQIIDDILDITGDPRRTGKPNGMDIRSGTITLPLILAVRSGGWNAFETCFAGRGGVDDQVTFKPGARPMTDDAVDQICRWIEESGGTDKARRVAATYLHRALAEIVRLPAGTGRACLEAIVKRLLEQEAVNQA